MSQLEKRIVDGVDSIICVTPMIDQDSGKREYYIFFWQKLKSSCTSSSFKA